MAQRPDGKPARTERVTFTKPAAERIAKVVRAVEGGDRDTGPLTFGVRMSTPGGSPIVLAKFTGSSAWLRMTARQCLLFPTSTDTVSTTPLYVGAFAGQTVTAVSLMFSMPGFTGATNLANYTTLGRYVMLSKVNGVYQVIAGEGN
jgi:hypothetical protein